MSNPTKPPSGQQRLGHIQVAEALNEHGFLFQLLIRQKIEKRPSDPLKANWEYVENEYPVTAVDGTETRIDLVLHHRSRLNGGLHMCLECKRPNPNHKTWLFFDRQQHPAMFFEQVVDEGDPRGRTHGLFKFGRSHTSPVFNYYLEVAIKRGSGSISSTKTIEEALRQVVAANNGLILKLLTFKSQPKRFWSVPVVVTTAELLEVEFNVEDVSLSHGMIASSKINLMPHEFIAVNYHADNCLSLKHKAWTISDLKEDLANFQTRTVFVVQSSAIDAFLSWAETVLG
jgi:hypothetical protein